MRFTAVAVAAGIVIGLVARGRFSNMNRRALRGWPLLAAGIATQAAAGRVGGPEWTTPLVLLSYALLLGFALFNLRLAGMGVVMIGMAANATVIGLNDGMPIRPSAVVAAGLATPEQAERMRADVKRRPERRGDRLVVLADIVPVAPLREVVSFGDLAIGVGIADVIVHLMRTRSRIRSKAAAPVIAAT
ncbi:MAG TPA: DUF5317 family protein [Acidimicrobiales bacterium]|nr:DUF5317 family protein [Acidimicrobiales bacterium]